MAAGFAALMSKAQAVILAHNHPSGDAGPSHEDVQLTKVIRSALDLFGIRLLDHVIITSDSHVSFSDDGLL